MLLQKKTLALCSSGASSTPSSTLACLSQTPRSYFRCVRPSCPFYSSIPECRQRRRYATVHNGGGKWSDTNNGSDVPAWPQTSDPTPYDIFDISRGAPYTKRRFYQLVKLYHPDTHDHHRSNTTSGTSAGSSTTLSEATVLERYRLVVAANDLLSDPSKRRLYDLHGIGWTADHRGPSLRDADRAWRYQPGNASANATWEDWERWREAHNPRNGRAEPLYMSNGLFAALVVMMCMVGAVAQSNRAEHMGDNYVGTLENRHANITEDMRRSHSATRGLSKEERVESFVKDRENTAYQFRLRKYDDPLDKPS